jgi:hypothetical protein
MAEGALLWDRTERISSHERVLEDAATLLLQVHVGVDLGGREVPVTNNS